MKLTLKRGAIGVAALSLAALSTATAPAFAHDDKTVVINGVSFSDDDFLQDLIDLDAEDIAELREEFADAKYDVLDAIEDIEEAREDVKGVPGGGMILKVAFGVASKTVSATTGEAFDEVRAALTDAEKELKTKRAEIGEAEFAETSEAIGFIRAGIGEVEIAIAQLTAAMNG
ncbi:MAG: hypothetical protein AAGJ87_05060 [Pseudomonadota bacterium]